MKKIISFIPQLFILSVFSFGQNFKIDKLNEAINVEIQELQYLIKIDTTKSDLKNMINNYKDLTELYLLSNEFDKTYVNKLEEIKFKLTDIKRLKASEQLIDRLSSEKIPSSKMSEIIEKKDKWENSKDNDDWDLYLESINNVANTYNIKSKVTFRTSPKPGAIIKYQTRGARKRKEMVLTVGSSECEDNFSIGNYYFWSERNGLATSDINNLYVVTEDKLINIIEFSSINE